MTLSPQLSVTHTSTVTPDQIDHLGHMNVRYYQRNAAAATANVLTELGIDPAGAPLVDMYTRHHHEQLEGSPLRVQSALTGHGEGLRIYHELRNADTDQLAATFLHTVAHRAVEAPGIDIPAHGAPRSIDPEADTLANAPTLAEVRRLGLENRAERTVDATDMIDGPGARPELGANLVWGGPPPGGGEKEFIRRGPDGQRVGYATMETRLVVAEVPALGTRIQSFGAIATLGEKVSVWRMWAYDLDTEHLLVSFDVVSLAFDLDARRAIAVPPSLRDGEQHRVRPELFGG